MGYFVAKVAVKGSDKSMDFIGVSQDSAARHILNGVVATTSSMATTALIGAYIEPHLTKASTTIEFKTPTNSTRLNETPTTPINTHNEKTIHTENTWQTKPLPRRLLQVTEVNCRDLINKDRVARSRHLIWLLNKPFSV